MRVYLLFFSLFFFSFFSFFLLVCLSLPQFWGSFTYPFPNFGACLPVPFLVLSFCPFLSCGAFWGCFQFFPLLKMISAFKNKVLGLPFRNTHQLLCHQLLADLFPSWPSSRTYQISYVFRHINYVRRMDYTGRWMYW